MWATFCSRRTTYGKNGLFLEVVKAFFIVLQRMAIGGLAYSGDRDAVLLLFYQGVTNVTVLLYGIYVVSYNSFMAVFVVLGFVLLWSNMILRFCIFRFFASRWLVISRFR